MESGLKHIIRVLIVEDSLSMCKVIEHVLNADPQIIVAGVAHNGKDAVALVPALKPDLITMDIHMPVMDGFEATKQIMASAPTPILILAASVFTEEMRKVFKAISYGALDVFDKNEIMTARDENGQAKLIEKIKFLSSIKVLHHPLAKLEESARPAAKVSEVPRKKVSDKIVCLVTSTGGPEALRTILKKFPGNFPCGIVIVQHIVTGFDQGLAEWLADECRIKVKIAYDAETIEAGTAYIAPCELQMRVDENGKTRLSEEPPYCGHRPSGDILLESVAKTYKDRALAVIMTGMGKDGAAGMKAVKDNHGLTIAQDEESSLIFGMPKAAIDMGAIDKVLPLEEIAEEIIGKICSGP